MTGKRRRFVPISVHFAHGSTGTALLEEFGKDGLLVWVCLIAAAKRSAVQGQYIHLSDAETWATFGLASSPPEFSFEDFLKATGKLHQTSRRRSGRVLYVSLTHWDEWNPTRARPSSGAQNTSKTNDFGQTLDGSKADEGPPDSDSESDSEHESEEEQDAPAPPSPPKSAVRTNPLWDAVASVTAGCEDDVTETAASLIGKTVRELKKVGATPEEVHRRAAAYRRHWPLTDLTPNAMRKWWADMGRWADEQEASSVLPAWVASASPELRAVLERYPDRVWAEEPVWWQQKVEDGLSVDDLVWLLTREG